MLAEFIDPAVLGFILIGVMLFSIFVGFPISFTLIFLGFVFDDLTVLNGHDRTNTRRSPTLCLYGNNDGTVWSDGEIIFSISTDVSQSKRLFILCCLICFCNFCSSNRYSGCFSDYTWNYGCKINEQIWL